MSFVGSPFTIRKSVAALLVLGCSAAPAWSQPVPAAHFHLFRTRQPAKERPAPAVEPLAGRAGVPRSPFPVRVGRDIRALVATPLHLSRRNWAWIGAGAALVGAARLVDDRGRVVARKDSDKPEDLRLANNLRPIAEAGGLVALGATWLAGRIASRPEVVATAQDGLEATLLAAGLVAPALKALTGRARPRQDEGSSSFQLFGSNQSFPSGEVTEAFAIASVVSAHTHKRWVKGVMWTLAAATGWERMRLDAHWASDVVAGGLVGAGVGRWVVHRHRPRRSDRPRLVLLPEVGPREVGFNLAVVR